MSYIRDPNNPNPLSRFRSYSYYHVLVVCDSDETAKELATTNTDVVAVWLHAGGVDTAGRRTQGTGRTYNQESFVEDALAGTKFAKRTLPSGSGEYCVLIHGATDADLVITKFAYTTIMNVNAAGNDRGSSMAVEGSIEVSEPKGIMFMNTVVLACNSLGKDPSTARFMIKTFFVGYNEEDQVETISTVAPLRFMITDMVGSFSTEGGVYTISIVGAVNGQGRLPQFDKLDRSLSITGDTLVDVVQQIQMAIDKSYDKMYNCIVSQVSRTPVNSSTNITPAELANSLKRVAYKIELHENYQDPIYAFKTPSAQNSSDGKCNSKAIISSGKDHSIESALQLMMQSCQRVEQDGSIGTVKDIITSSGIKIPAGTKVQYRIQPTVDTHKSTPEGNGPIMTVTYRIEPYPVPANMIELAADPTSNIVQEMIAPNTLYLEYMYTGKNVDILEFDMKMNIGMAYLMMGTIVNTHRSQTTATPSRVQTSDGKKIEQHATRTGAGKPLDIPVVFSTQLDLPHHRTTPQPISTHDNVWNMTKQASLESLGVSMKITGNLHLIESINSTMQPTTTSDDNGIKMMHWGTLPCYAKVNIMMPSSNDDIALFSGSADRAYATSFWYDGYYYMTMVEHVFEDGDFVQNVQLLSMPKFDTTQQNTQNEQKETFSSNVLDCYNGAECGDPVGAASASSTNKTIDQSPAAKQTEQIAKETGTVPQIYADLVDRAIWNSPLDNVNGWTTVDTAVKEQMHRAATGDHITPTTYAIFMMMESSGQPRAEARNSKNELITPSKRARGLFQFIPTTWNSVMPSNRVTDLTSDNDPRFDPYLATVAARNYMANNSKSLGGTNSPTWLYMSHNLGPNAARAVKKLYEQGQCVPMAELYAANPTWGSWSNVAKNNRYNINSTTCDIRDQVASKLYARIKSEPIAAAAPPQATTTTPSTQTAPQRQTEGQRTAARAIGAVNRRCIPRGEDGKTPEDKTDPCANKTEPNTDKTGWSAGKSAAFVRPKQD